jgi:undecaprenyl-diphosphatase
MSASMSWIDIFILSLVEGLTEFIPVSSTGHLILAGHILNLSATEFQKAFDIVIQFGAILAVVVLYRKQFRWNFSFYKKLAIAFLPVGVIGFLLKDKVSEMMESTAIVAWALIIGGIVMIALDRFYKKGTLTNLSEKNAFLIGLFQCLALVPGVSRSGATIIGSQLLGMTKEKAAEFSFLLAVPTITIASLYKLYKVRSLIEVSHLAQMAVGILLSFVFAIVAIRFFIEVVKRSGFGWFGVYRIILGVFVLVSIYK